MKHIIGILFCALAAGCAAPVAEAEAPPPTEPPKGRLVTDAPLPGTNPAFKTVPGLTLER